MISDSKPKAHGSNNPSDYRLGTEKSDFDKANELPPIVPYDIETLLAPFSPPTIADLHSALSPEMRELVSKRDLPAARRDRVISMALRTIYPALDKNG